MRAISVICGLLLSCSLSAQLAYTYDTLDLNTRTHGVIDSMDYKAADLAVSFEGGRSLLSAEGLSLDRLFDDYTNQVFQGFYTWKPLRYTRIPHLGFSYTFGGQGSQYLSASYAQVFDQGLVLNVNYDRKSATGVIRNTNFSNDNVALRLEKKGNIYSFKVDGAYRTDSIHHAGGLLDSLGDLSLELTPVNKNNAASRSQRGELHFTNYLNFSGDSVSQIGLTTKHSYQILNRRYFEIDTLYAIYDNVFIDSVSTADKYNHASVSNSAGFYIWKNAFYIDGRIGHRYWRFNNLGNDFDTTEIDLSSSLIWKRSDIQIQNQFNFNLIGGFNEWSNRFSANYQRGKLNVGGKLALINEAPDPIMRSYRSNNYSYDLSSVELQSMLKVGGSLSYVYSPKLSVTGFTDYAGLDKTYLFNDSIWTNSTGSLNMLSIGGSGNLTLGKFHFHPKVVYSVQSEGYLPDFQGYLRVYAKTGVFKAKKLLTAVGVDLSYVSAFNHRAYIPGMDSYNWLTTPLKTPMTQPLTNLHAFLSFEIDNFRFYTRFENIGSFWSSRDNEELEGYPLNGTRLKIGVTWDFFN